ncbi:hypothetical protein RclHR1_01920017 [Rhizophagus clarus]|uniref:Uncharacterized protein n=1 Tax=Rhizophagus clarus TaxID=94130 RepID=A0A2Z6QNB2_9GLOM|nr:hypothetical protein RclHR1_01920017 [Rhizophagus clarus]GES84052.1 hypothetical protein RCL_jg19584.t1 [Rhizophagus clarus]
MEIQKKSNRQSQTNLKIQEAPTLHRRVDLVMFCHEKFAGFDDHQMEAASLLSPPIKEDYVELISLDPSANHGSIIYCSVKSKFSNLETTIEFNLSCGDQAHQHNIRNNPPLPLPYLTIYFSQSFSTYLSFLQLIK